MTKNEQVALKELMQYAFLVAIAAEHFAYSIYMRESGEEEIANKNALYASQKLKESYDLIPNDVWAKEIGYLWDINHTKAIQ